MNDLRRTPFARALHRPNLLMGGERELVLLTALLAGGLAITSMNVIAIGISAAVWFGALGLLRMMAKADPQISQVYLRSIKYRAYYSGR